MGYFGIGGKLRAHDLSLPQTVIYSHFGEPSYTARRGGCQNGCESQPVTEIGRVYEYAENAQLVFPFEMGHFSHLSMFIHVTCNM